MLNFPFLEITKTETYGPPVKGLNTRWSPFVIGKDEAATLLNYQVNGNGVLETYPGYVLDGSPFPDTSTSFIRTLFDFKRGSALDLLMVAASDTTNNANATYTVDIKQTVGDGTYQYFGHTIGTASFTASNTSVTGTNTHWSSELKAGDKIKLASDTDAKYTEIASVGSDTSLTLVAGGYLGTTGSGAYIARKILNNASIPRFITFNNLCLITNGSDSPQAYDSTSLNLITNSYSGTTLTQSGTTAPNGKYILKHKNRVFMAATTSAPSRLFWSHAFDQTYWDPNSFEDIFPQDGGSIVSINVFADSIIVFKNTGLLYQVVGNFDDSTIGTVSYVRKLDVTDHLGIIAERSPVVHNNALYFLCQTGLYRIDTRMYVEKVSYILDPTISGMNFAAQGQTNKAFIFNSQSTWNNSNTESGFYAKTDGIVRSFFDEHIETDANQGFNQCSIAIGTDNAVHVAYVPSTNTQKITYLRMTADSVIRKEDTGVVNGKAISFVSIAVSPSDQTVGIVYGNDNTTGFMKIVERTPDSGPTFGTWGSPATVVSTGSGTAQGNAVLLYSSGGVPISAWTITDGSGHNFVQYSQRNAGVWSGPSNVDSFNSTGGLPLQIQRVALCLDGSNNPYVTCLFAGNTQLNAFKSTNGGATWNLIENFIVPTDIDYESNLACALDNSGDLHTYWSDGSFIWDRNHVTTTSVKIDSSSLHPLLRGAFTFFDSNDNYPTGVQETYAWNISGLVGSQQERVTFDSTNELSNPTTNVIAKKAYFASSTSGYRPAGSALVHNGRTCAMVGFGTSANQIIIRRICFKGSWQSAVNSDNTLISWGQMVVSGASGNGNTITYQLATASSNFTPNPSLYTTVIPPVLISSSSSNIFVSAKIQTSLTTWAGVQVASLILNYVGAGIDSSQVFGIDYYNEMYFANSQASITNNDILLLDIKDAFLQTGYPVNCMEMLGTTLYGGSSTNGDLYKLRQGYLFNGNPYTSTYISKEDFLGSFEFTKDIYKLYVIYEIQSSGTFTFSYRLDNFSKTGGMPWISAVVDQTGATLSGTGWKTSGPGIIEIYPIGPCRSIQFKIESMSNNQLSGIVGWSIVYNLQNLR